MISEQRFLLNDAQETKLLGEKLARSLCDHTALIFLSGDLGAGKTTFAQGLVTALCNDVVSVPSPTYSYMQIYRARVAIFHFDLYRIDDHDSIFSLGLAEHLADATALRLVEWPERLPNNFIKADIVVELSENSQGRTAVIKYFSPLPIIA